MEFVAKRRFDKGYERIGDLNLDFMINGLIPFESKVLLTANDYFLTPYNNYLQSKTVIERQSFKLSEFRLLKCDNTLPHSMVFKAQANFFHFIWFWCHLFKQLSAVVVKDSNKLRNFKG